MSVVVDFQISVAVKRSLATLDFADDFAVEQRQQSVVVRHFLVYNSTVKLVTRLPKKIPENRSH